MKQIYIYKELADIAPSSFAELHAIQISAWADLNHSEKLQAMIHLDLDERDTFDEELHRKNDINSCDPKTIIVDVKCVFLTKKNASVIIRGLPYLKPTPHNNKSAFFDGHDETELLGKLKLLELDDKEHNFIEDKIKKYMKLNVFS